MPSIIACKPVLACVNLTYVLSLCLNVQRQDMVTAPQSNLCKVLLLAASIRDSRSQSITGTCCSQCMAGLQNQYVHKVL